MKKFIYILLFIFLFSSFDVAKASNLYYYDDEWKIHNENISIKLDDVKINFDVEPIIIEDRTMVPARAFFEKAGAKVLWDQATQVVTINSATHSVKLTINSTTALVNGIKTKLDVPAKIITDSKGIGRTIIPLRFISEQLGYKVLWDESTYTVSVYIENDIPDDAVDGYTITEITNSYDNNTDIVTIKANNTNNEPKVSYLHSPERLILDFEGFKVNFSDGSTGKTGKSVSNVRYASHEDYFRVVIDLKNSSEYSIVKGNGIYKVIIDGSTFKNITYTNFGGFKIEIDDSSKVYFTSSDKNLYTFTINSQNLGEGVIEVDDTYIDKIVLTKKNSKTQIDVYANEKLNYKIATEGSKQVINFTRTGGVSDNLSVTLSSKAKNMLVVIDPGHGGTDCGALGKDEDGAIDLMEKDVTLDISTYLSEYLTKAGVKNLMTRTDDTFVELLDRTKIANDANAELFVSVHVNSFYTEAPNGTSVYYYKKPDPKEIEEKEDETDEDSQLITESGEEAEEIKETKITTIAGDWFAQTVQDELLKRLNTTDRGIVDGSKLVVIKHTAMPAILVETAFISNEKDKELLKSKEFRKETAKAIAEGIIKALNETVRIRENLA